MSLLFFAHTLDVLGKILLGITVLGVHLHVLKEHKINSHVLRAMKSERFLGISGIVLIVVAYAITVFLEIA